MLTRKPTVFIHTNSKQMLGAHVGKYTFKKMSKNPDAFDVEFICLEDFPQLTSRQGQPYLRKGSISHWDNNDLQSFTPLRFLPPKLMNYEGKAVVVDPDVFAVTGDVMDLFNRDMGGKAILCRRVVPTDGRPWYWGTSVMLLDCKKLKHWNWDQNIENLFQQKIDYRDWMSLFLEDQGNIGELEECWNRYDELDEDTKFLHNTGRLTQPWRTGLKVDFSNENKFAKTKVEELRTGASGFEAMLPWKARLAISFVKKRLGIAKSSPKGNVTPRKPQVAEYYREHPDKNQEKFFFQTLQELRQKNIITDDYLRESIAINELRKDAFEVLNRWTSASN